MAGGHSRRSLRSWEGAICPRGVRDCPSGAPRGGVAASDDTDRNIEVTVHLLTVVASLAFLALAVACALASVGDASIGESFARVVADPWGRTMVVDLNAAFVALVIVVWLFEPRRAVAVVVTLLTPALGSFVPLAWLIARRAHLLRLPRPQETDDLRRGTAAAGDG
jgi:hypothetical protein